MKKSLKVLDLFSGIGGFSHALHSLGHFETVAFCEIDKECHKVLNKNFPGIPIFYDVNELTYNSVTGYGIDVICGGFPCTDISTAGKQKGLIDERTGKATRSGLWFQYKRIIEEVRPKWVVIENVPNLRSKGLGVVLKDLWELGYNAEWEIISARSIGACHFRQRIWIVAYANCESIREQPGRSVGQKRKSSTVTRHFSKDGSFTTSDSNCNGLDRETVSVRSENEEKSSDSSGSGSSTSDSDNFRCFFPTFASEEEKSEWWAKTRALECDWWEAESSVRGMDDAISDRLDKGNDRNSSTQERAEEKARQERIKQLGNAIVPGVARIIGRQILYHERLIDS